MFELCRMPVPFQLNLRPAHCREITAGGSPGIWDTCAETILKAKGRLLNLAGFLNFCRSPLPLSFPFSLGKFSCVQLSVAVIQSSSGEDFVSIL